MITLMEHSQNLASLEDVSSLPLVTAFIIDFWIIPAVTRERFWQVSLRLQTPLPYQQSILSPLSPQRGSCLFPWAHSVQGPAGRTSNILSLANKKSHSCQSHQTWPGEGPGWTQNMKKSAFPQQNVLAEIWPISSSPYWREIRLIWKTLLANAELWSGKYCH